MEDRRTTREEKVIQILVTYVKNVKGDLKEEYSKGIERRRFVLSCSKEGGSGKNTSGSLLRFAYPSLI